MTAQGAEAATLTGLTGPPDLRQRLLGLGVPPDQPLALALSGGPDSLALALLCQAQGLQIACYHVDHGLRASSAAEAAALAAQCARLGLPLTLLTLDRCPPGMSGARGARYDALLAQAGERFLLLGHHRDDQLETLAMRLERGSGLRGLAGMSARRGRLVRPLLDLPKSQLVDGIRAAGLDALTDPSNVDPRYRRAFWRQRLADQPRLAAELSALQPPLARLRRWTEQQALAGLDRLVRAGDLRAGDRPEAELQLELAGLPPQPAVRQDLLRRCIAAVSGRGQAAFDPLGDLPGSAAGCLLQRRRGRLLLRPDPRCPPPGGRPALARLDREVFAIVSPALLPIFKDKSA